MNETEIIVTYLVKPAARGRIEEILRGHGKISYLTGVTPRERAHLLAGADVLLTWDPAKELQPEEFSLFRKLRMIQLLSAGADHFPFSSFPPDIVVASNIGAYSQPIAEHILGMALAFAKKFFREHIKMSRGEFDQAPNRRLRGAVCGILGFGGIGRATARLMKCFGARIQAANTSGKTQEPVDFIGTLNDLKEILSSSDIVVICLPLNRITRGLIGRRELEWMKKDAILINVARGGIIDEAALYDHLSNNPGFSAGIDVWWAEPSGKDKFRTRYPFFMLPNVLGSPHNSAIVPGMDEEGSRLAAENIKRFLRGQPVVGLVRREDYI